MNSRNSYLELLEESWQAHLAERESDAPTVISTFAGAGGSSLGYSMAGFRELLAVEWDDNAVKTFRLNFPDVPIYHGDIHDLTVEQAIEMAGLSGSGELDVLDGSPPCQGFSTAGKRQMLDPRNELYNEYVRLLRGLKPKVFVMENVSGLVKGKMKLIFADIMKQLKASGYRVKCKLLDAQYLNVPQCRQRLIWIGIREDLEGEPSFPKPQNRPIAADKAIEYATTIECGQPKVLLVDRMKRVKPGSNLGRTEGTSRHFSYVRCPIGRPAMTLQKSVTFGGISMWHPIEERNMSIDELKRISSFPSKFQLVGSYEIKIGNLGNSVPPFMMKAIAEHVRDHILPKRLAGMGLDCRLAEESPTL